jgi:hypothetical protein
MAQVTVAFRVIGINPRILGTHTFSNTRTVLWVKRNVVSFNYGIASTRQMLYSGTQLLNETNIIRDYNIASGAEILIR